jgi:hypothetical protein
MLGRILLSITGLGQILGPFIADFNETHVKNPRWPPHARFHNGQTMSMGLCLGLATMYYTFRRNASVEKERESLFTAMIFGSVYWVTGLSAILYPGSLAVDPEFGEGFPQFWLFVGLLGCAVVGWGFEVLGLEGEERKKV